MDLRRKSREAIRRAIRRRSYQREYSRRWRREHHELALRQYRYGNRTQRGVYRHYKYGAKRRGIRFELSFEQFSGFWGKPCYYCGAPIERIGLDRVENRKGYVRGNVVACCKFCNMAKSDLSVWEYVRACALVTMRHHVQPT